MFEGKVFLQMERIKTTLLTYSFCMGEFLLKTKKHSYRKLVPVRPSPFSQKWYSTPTDHASCVNLVLCLFWLFSVPSFFIYIKHL